MVRRNDVEVFRRSFDFGRKSGGGSFDGEIDLPTGEAEFKAWVIATDRSVNQYKVDHVHALGRRPHARARRGRLEEPHRHAALGCGRMRSRLAAGARRRVLPRARGFVGGGLRAVRRGAVGALERGDGLGRDARIRRGGRPGPRGGRQRRRRGDRRRLRARGHVSPGRQPRGRRIRRRADRRGRLLRARLPRDGAGRDLAKHVSRRGRSLAAAASRYGGLAVATPGTVRGLEALHGSSAGCRGAGSSRPRSRSRGTGFTSRPDSPRELAEEPVRRDLSRDRRPRASSFRRETPLAPGTLLVQPELARDARSDRRAGSGRISPRRDRAPDRGVRPRDRRRPDGGGPRRLRARLADPVRVRLRPLAARDDAAAVVGRFPPRVDPRAASLSCAGRSRRAARRAIHSPDRRGRAPRVRRPEPLSRRPRLRGRAARAAPRPRPPRRARLLDRPRAGDAVRVDPGGSWPGEREQTTHLSVATADGEAVVAHVRR